VEIIVRKPTEGEIIYMQRELVWEGDCSEFDYHCDYNETYLLEKGQVTITYNGKTISFGAGDLVFVPKGLDCHWKITSPVKKYERW